MLLPTKYCFCLSCGPRGFRHGDYYVFPHYKSMEAIDTWSVANLNHIGKYGIFYVGDYKSLLYIKYTRYGSHGLL